MSTQVKIDTYKGKTTRAKHSIIFVSIWSSYCIRTENQQLMACIDLTSLQNNNICSNLYQHYTHSHHANLYQNTTAASRWGLKYMQHTKIESA